MELGRTAYVILGMLKLGRRTGYEIKSLVDVSTRFFWAASYGQIYPELARLEEAGLISGEPDRSNGRGRKTYELTRAGERALEEWLTSDDALHIEFRHEGALKLFFSDFLPLEQRRAQLRRIREAHERVAEQLEQVRPGAQQAAEESGNRLPYLTLEFGIAFQEFVADWCERAERELSSKTTTRS
jgi:PadR family transcriptional regulator AphA